MVSEAHHNITEVVACCICLSLQGVAIFLLYVDVPRCPNNAGLTRHCIISMVTVFNDRSSTSSGESQESIRWATWAVGDSPSGGVVAWNARQGPFLRQDIAKVIAHSLGKLCGSQRHRHNMVSLSACLIHTWTRRLSTCV